MLNLSKIKADCFWTGKDLHTEIQSLLIEYIEEHPNKSPDLLECISFGLNNYSEKIKQHRQSQSKEAIKHLYMTIRRPYKNNREIKELSKQNAMLIMLSLYIAFPNGFKSAYTINDKEMLMMFCKTYFNDRNERDWEQRHFSDKGEGSKWLDILEEQYKDEKESNDVK